MMMKSDAASSVFTRNMVKDLSKHIQFPDSAQDEMLDKL
jgi:hypothetical protein